MIENQIIIGGFQFNIEKKHFRLSDQTKHAKIGLCFYKILRKEAMMLNEIVKGKQVGKRKQKTSVGVFHSVLPVLQNEFFHTYNWNHNQ